MIRSLDNSTSSSTMPRERGAGGAGREGGGVEFSFPLLACSLDLDPFLAGRDRRPPSKSIFETSCETSFRTSKSAIYFGWVRLPRGIGGPPASRSVTALPCLLEISLSCVLASRTVESGCEDKWEYSVSTLRPPGKHINVSMWEGRARAGPPRIVLNRRSILGVSRLEHLIC